MRPINPTYGVFGMLALLWVARLATVRGQDALGYALQALVFVLGAYTFWSISRRRSR